MNRTEVGATRSNNDALNNPPASFLSASMTYLPIGMMVILEVAFFAPDVSVVRHRISTEVNTFSQSFFNGLKHGSKILLRYSVWVRKGMDSRTPENLIGVNITDTGNQTLVHEHLLYFSLRSFQNLRLKNFKLKNFLQRLWSKVFEVQRLFQFRSFYQCHFGKLTHIG